VEAKLPLRVGVITHYYPHVDAGIVSLERGELKVGDTLHVRGHTTDFYQRVDRMELDHQPVTTARAGQQVGIHVSQRVREGDEVFLVSS
jgi:putative protease